MLWEQRRCHGGVPFDPTGRLFPIQLQAGRQEPQCALWERELTDIEFLLASGGKRGYFHAGLLKNG